MSLLSLRTLPKHLQQADGLRCAATISLSDVTGRFTGRKVRFGFQQHVYRRIELVRVVDVFLEERKV